MTDEVQKAEADKTKLLASAKSLFVTIPEGSDADISAGNPSLADIGVSPFIIKEGRFYIYASVLSAHVRLLRKQDTARFMVIADESQSQNIWARHRVKFIASVAEIDRKDPEFSDICDAIGAAHGPVMELIRQFSDFHLFQITPQSGILVTGFGAAFSLEGEGLVVIEKLRSG